MKCSDIPDKDVLEFLAQHQGSWSTWGKGYSMPTVQDVMPGAPAKLQLAKMRQMLKKGFIGGCMCGCRGDFEITDKGLAFIGRTRVVPYNGYGELEGSVTTGFKAEAVRLKNEGYVMGSVTSKIDPNDQNVLVANITFTPRKEEK